QSAGLLPPGRSLLHGRQGGRGHRCFYQGLTGRTRRTSADVRRPENRGLEKEESCSLPAAGKAAVVSNSVCQYFSLSVSQFVSVSVLEDFTFANNFARRVSKD